MEQQQSVVLGGVGGSPKEKVYDTPSGRIVGEASSSTFKYWRKVKLDSGKYAEYCDSFAFQLIPSEDGLNVAESELSRIIRVR